MPSIKVILDQDHYNEEKIFKNATAYEDTELGYLIIYDMDPTDQNERGRGEQRARLRSKIIDQWEIIEDANPPDEEVRRSTRMRPGQQ